MDIEHVYLDFVVERHKVWQRRQAQRPLESRVWSEDPIINEHKFTNVFRILDVGSQFVVRELLYGDDVSFHDKLARVFLYRYTNRPEPWEHFREMYGEYPVYDDIFSGRLLDEWRGYRAAGYPIFGGAYKMFSGAENKGIDRLTWAVNLTRDAITPDFAERFQALDYARERHALLTTIPRCANFMAMQILTDIGLSAELAANENQFVVAGPGAIRGAAVLDTGFSPFTVIQLAFHWLAELEDCPVLYTPSGRARMPSYMDVQNTLCEFSKYVRYQEQGPTGRLYRPAHPGPQPLPFLPPHW